jgi:hypothetical protein
MVRRRCLRGNTGMAGFRLGASCLTRMVRRSRLRRDIGLEPRLASGSREWALWPACLRRSAGMARGKLGLERSCLVTCNVCDFKEAVEQLAYQ